MAPEAWWPPAAPCWHTLELAVWSRDGANRSMTPAEVQARLNEAQTRGWVHWGDGLLCPPHAEALRERR